MKLLASALLLAAASQANAALVLPTTENGSLFLTVWDSVASKSYTRDLGLKLNDFLSGIAPTAMAPPPFAGDALFASTFAASTASNIKWNIVAGDGVSSTIGTYNPTRLITTGVAAPLSTLTNGGMTTATTSTKVFESAANLNGCDLNASCATNDPANTAFGGKSNWGNNFGNVTAFNNAGTGFGSSLGFYYLSSTNTGLFGKASINKFANATGAASWTLNSDGSAVYVPAPSAVPVPAAIWLLGSGLIGMVGVARRKSAV